MSVGRRFGVYHREVSGCPPSQSSLWGGYIHRIFHSQPTQRAGVPKAWRNENTGERIKTQIPETLIQRLQGDSDAGPRPKWGARRRTLLQAKRSKETLLCPGTSSTDFSCLPKSKFSASVSFINTLSRDLGSSSQRKAEKASIH